MFSNQPVTYDVSLDGPHVKRFQQRGYWTAGVSADMPPFATRDPDGGWSGFEIDLILRITSRLFNCSMDEAPNHVEFLATGFGDREAALVDGAVDIVAQVFVDTPDRRRNLVFAGHYMSGQPAVLLRPEVDAASVRRVEDLNGLRVVALPKSTGASLLERHAPKADGILLGTVTECVDAVRSGAADAFWSSVAENHEHTKPGSELRQAKLGLRGEPWAVAVRRDHKDVAIFIDSVMAQMLADWSLDKMLRRWFRTKLS